MRTRSTQSSALAAAGLLPATMVGIGHWGVLDVESGAGRLLVR